jgi:hypothetical protein
MVARAGTGLLLLGALVGCTEEPPITTTPRPVISSPNAPSVSTALPERPDRSIPQIVNVNVLDGGLTGDVGEVPVRLGSLVRLTVLADVADVVVVEGYGQTIQTAVGQAVQLELLADEAGSFDVTLRDSGTRLTTLVVR